MMLSRHAEDLFWAGRYLERVQDTARLLDVAYHRSVTSPRTTSGDRWREVASILMLDPDGDTDVMRHSVIDDDNPNAVYSLLDAVRENVRRVRELLSSELWEAVNNAWLRLRGHNVRYEIEQHPSLLLGEVKTHCQTIIGGAVETMPHDEALRFLRLGGQLERAAFTCRVVDVSARPLLASGRSLGDWLHVLRTCAGAEAYLRKGGAGLPDTDVIRFLLLDAAFPRSVAHAVGECDAHVGALDPIGDSDAARTAGRLVAELRYADLDEWLDGDLEGVLADLHERVERLSDAVAARFFGRGDPDPFQIQAVSSGGRSS